MEHPASETISGLIQNAYASFALLAGMQLDVFTPLSDGPLDARQVAEKIGVSTDLLSPLLYALAAAGLLHVEDNRFVNGGEARRYLVASSPEYVGNLHHLLSDLWSATLRTADSIRLGQPQAEHSFAGIPAGQLFAFFRGLHDESLAAGRQLVEHFDTSSCTRLLDVGGGSGGLSIGFVQGSSNFHATVLDLPEVIPVASQFIQKADLAERIRTLALDVTRKPVPGEFDAAVVKAFIQTLPPDQAVVALSHVTAALRPGGAVYILGNGILDDCRCTPREAALFNIVFLNIYRGGRAYTESEYRNWLIQAGFADVRRVRQRNGSSMITARKT
ncbi:MAG: methyltransferase [Gemmatimonadota bacterium]|nr:methyltransferase [Gemmatimonadota bacterium]